MPGYWGIRRGILSEFAKLKTLGDIVAMYERGVRPALTACKLNEATVAVSTSGTCATDSFDSSALVSHLASTD